MLIYHPAYDAYHCVFRIISITDTVCRLEFAKLRILDFYLCFPAEVEKVRLPPEHSRIRKWARESHNAYRGPVSAARTFRDMYPIQVAAARLMAASGLFAPDQLELGMVVRTDASIPPGLLEVARAYVANQDEVGRFVLTELSDLPLHGQGGLKDRSGLMEYRYDVL